jgi:predicted CxxxxCH...CXXCH cytochrome family protein
VNKVKGSAFASCATSYCHSSGQSANGLSATPVYGTAPTWGGTAACGSCHATDTLATGSHTKHFTGIKPDTNCGNCHTNSTLAAYNNTTHVDGSINVGEGTYTAAGTPGNGYGTCSTASCHNDGTSNAVQPATPQWGNTGTACAICHAASPTTGSHTRHLTTTMRLGVVSIVCADCHTSGAAHLDGTVDIISGSGYPQDITKHAAGTYSGSCSTVYCHSNGSTAARATTYKPINWNAAQLDCEGCHPTSGLTSGHSVHISTLLTERKSSLSYSTYSANVSNGSVYKFGCANCHPVTSTNHLNGTVDVDMATTANSGTLKAKNPGGATYDMTTTKKCSNVYCHSNGYSAKAKFADTPAWTATFTGDKCAGCHGNSPGVFGQISGSRAHTVHEVGIHYENIFNGVKGRLPKADANRAINSAHGYNRATVISCNICHNLTIADGRNALNPTCATNSCHGTGGVQTAAAISNTSKHINGNIDVAFAPVVVKSKAQVRDISFSSYTAGTNGWSRANGYKNYTTSLDIAKSALSGTYTPGGDCTNACHNNFAIKWVAPTGECNMCHTRL